MLSLRRSKRFRRPAPRWSGQAIIGAILKGERDPWKLAELKHDMVRASQEEVARSLEGNWREDLVFELRQAVDSFHFAHQQMQQCDRQLESFLASLPTRTLGIPSDRATAAVTQRLKKERKAKRPTRNGPMVNLKAELKRICGVDLTSIDGVNVVTAQTIISCASSRRPSFCTAVNGRAGLSWACRRGKKNCSHCGDTRQKV